MLDSPPMKKLAVATVLAAAYALWREWSLAAETEERRLACLDGTCSCSNGWW